MRDPGPFPESHGPFYTEAAADKHWCRHSYSTGGNFGRGANSTPLRGSFNRFPDGSIPQACRCLGSLCPAWRWAEEVFEYSDVERPGEQGWEPFIAVPKHDEANKPPITAFRRNLGPTRRGWCGAEAEPTRA
jgi:hypothetical protein